MKKAPGTQRSGGFANTFFNPLAVDDGHLASIKTMPASPTKIMTNGMTASNGLLRGMAAPSPW